MNHTTNLDANADATAGAAELVRAIEQSDADGAQTLINQLMMQKSYDAIESKRADIAASLFK